MDLTPTPTAVPITVQVSYDDAQVMELLTQTNEKLNNVNDFLTAINLCIAFFVVVLIAKYAYKYLKMFF